MPSTPARKIREVPRVLQNPPPLKIDAQIYGIDGREMIPRCRLERRIVWNLLLHLAEKGFTPVSVVSDDEVKTPDSMAVMEEAFNLDDCRVVFRLNGAGPKRDVLLVFGNDGTDCISDWTYGKGDPDGFNAALEAFDPEMYA